MDWEEDEDYDDRAARPASYYAAPNRGSTEVIEIVLQTTLRYLGALADFLDRILSSFEATGAPQQQQRQEREVDDEGLLERRDGDTTSLWIRLFKWLGSGIRNLLPGLTLLPQQQDRNTLWLSSIVVLLVCFVFVGFRTGFGLFRIVEDLEVVEEPSSRTPSKRLLLPDGRNIAYREHGVGAEKARHSGLVVRGLAASSPAGIPGVNDSLLEQFMIRLVEYDLPGFGQSDPNPNRSFISSAEDMAHIGDALGFGERFWLLVQAGGGPYAWAAIRYIPERLSGVVMLAPVGNPYKADLLTLEAEAAATASKEWSLGWRLLLMVARRFPTLVRFFVDRKELREKITRINKGLYASVADKEQVLFEQKEFIAFWERNLRETIPKSKAAAPFEELLRLINGGWSFGLGRFGWLFKLVKLGFRFPSLRLRLPPIPIKRLFMWWWSRSKSRKQSGTPAPIAPAARSESPRPTSNQTWQVFKFKLTLVGIVIGILLLVLR